MELSRENVTFLKSILLLDWTFVNFMKFALSGESEIFSGVSTCLLFYSSMNSPAQNLSTL